MAKGYSPREIAYVIAQEAYTISLDRVLDIKSLEELQDLSDQEQENKNEIINYRNQGG